MKGDDIAERLLEFAVAVLRITTRLPADRPGRHLASQLVRAGSAGGAHYEEARGAESPPGSERGQGISLLVERHSACEVAGQGSQRTPPRSSRAGRDPGPIGCLRKMRNEIHRVYTCRRPLLQEVLEENERRSGWIYFHSPADSPPNSPTGRDMVMRAWASGAWVMKPRMPRVCSSNHRSVDTPCGLFPNQSGPP